MGKMRKRQLQVISIVGVIAVVVVISALFVKLGPGEASSIPKDKYVFLQVEENIGGAPVWIDKPVPYSFDETSGILLCGSSFEISDNLVMVLGKKTGIKEPGGGAAGGPIPIYAIPSSLGTLAIRSEILSVESDGTIHLTCDNTKITLKPGEEWENEYTTEWRGYQVSCIITIRNHGLQDKDKILFEG
jgi:hypothetical protein